MTKSLLSTDAFQAQTWFDFDALRRLAADPNFVQTCTDILLQRIPDFVSYVQHEVGTYCGPPGSHGWQAVTKSFQDRYVIHLSLSNTQSLLSIRSFPGASVYALTYRFAQTHGQNHWVMSSQLHVKSTGPEWTPAYVYAQSAQAGGSLRSAPSCFVPCDNVVGTEWGASPLSDEEQQTLLFVIFVRGLMALERQFFRALPPVLRPYQADSFWN